MLRAYLTGAGKVTAEPSCASSLARSTTARTWPSSSATPATPEPETAWYVETISRCRPASSLRTWSTGIAAMVVQLGLAMMPLTASLMASGLTSLTTSGTSGSIRNADELSMTMAPASEYLAASAREEPAPAENSAMSMPDRSAVDASSTTMSSPRQGN